MAERAHAWPTSKSGSCGLDTLPPTWADGFFHFTRVAVVQLAVAVLLAGLGVFKPGAQTRWGKKGR